MLQQRPQCAGDIVDMSVIATGFEVAHEDDGLLPADFDQSHLPTKRLNCRSIPLPRTYMVE
jgi:hypothetical protein